MKALLFMAAALCFAAALPARAQHMNAPDAPCQDKVVTTDLARCLDTAYRSADKRLNDLYGSVRKVLEPDELKGLQAAERSWVQFRDDACAAERALYGGGTGGGPAYLACLEAETRDRIKDLHAAYDWRLEK